MHILIISTGYPTDYEPLDGIFYKDQAEALVSAGCKVGFVAINPISVKSILHHKKLNLGFFKFNEKGVDTYLYKYINIPKFPTYCVKKAKINGSIIFDNYIENNGVPDIIHLHCYEAVLLAIHIKRKYNIPFVITEHSSRFLNLKIPYSMEQYAKMAFNESEYNICVSENFSKILKEKYNTQFHYVPNIVDTDFYKPLGNLSERKEFIMLSAGILNDNKNHSLLLNSFKLFLSSGRKAKLIIAGDGPNAKKLKHLSKVLMIEENVSFVGWISRRNLCEMMNNSSTFILPSLKETFGVVLIEAMSCGIPVISTKSGGPESIIKSNKSGILCEHNENSLYLALQKIYDNFAAYNSSDIRKDVLNNYSRNSVSKQLISIYKNIIEK